MTGPESSPERGPSGRGDDRRLRLLLEDAVADVHPRRGIDDIRARTGSDRPRRSWVWAASGAVVGTAATIAAVTVLLGLPGSGGTGPAPPQNEVPAGPRLVSVYFVGDTGVGPRLFQERREFGGRPDALTWSLYNVVQGNARDDDYTSAWPRGAAVTRARLQDGVITVDLSGPVQQRPAGMDRTRAAIGLQQVVRSAQDVTGTRLPVVFRHDGKPAATIMGLPTTQPITRAGDDSTLAPVSIASPGDQAYVHSPFTVTGHASAFEANVQWELMQGDAVVRHGFTTAKQCCTLSPYSFRVRAPLGQYTLVVHDEDASGGEGTPSSIDTKQILVR